VHRSKFLFAHANWYCGCERVIRFIWSGRPLVEANVWLVVNFLPDTAKYVWDCREVRVERSVREGNLESGAFLLLCRPNEACWGDEAWRTRTGDVTNCVFQHLSSNTLFFFLFLLLHYVVMSRGSSGSIVSVWLRTGRPEFVPRQRQGFFSSSLCVQTGAGAHPASCTMGTGGPLPGGKARPGRDADHSSPSSAEVKNE
jgi:hypothetical protein